MDDRQTKSTRTAAPMAAGPEAPATGLTDTAFNEGRRLAGDPNICGVGYGLKTRAGTPVAAGSLVFFVREKLRDGDEIHARGSWPVPPAIDGFPTDVVEVGRLAAAAADRAPPAGNRGSRVAAPLVGGTATMGLGAQVPGPGGYGTIGGLCFDSATNAPLLLSNAHVWGQTVPAEVAQPITATAVFGAAATPAVTGTPASSVLTRVPSAMTAPIAFANSVAQTYLITGSDTDPLVFGQGATVVAAVNRTDSEQVTIAVPPAGLAVAGRHVSPSPGWSYQRLGSSAAMQASSSAARVPTKLLAARRLFTNAATYTTSQTVNLYAEVIPAAGGVPATASSHFPIVYFYPVPAGNKLVPRLLRPTTRQPVTTVTTQFTGFPAPARVGAVTLPFPVTGGFTVDSTGAGTFQTANAGTLPAGTLALRLPVGTVRLFVPPSTQVVLDIDLRTFTGTLIAQGVSTAGDDVGNTNIPAAGANGRTQVTISASEIVEIRMTIAGTAVLYGVTALRASPEAAPPMSYAGSIAASVLGSGRWGASLFVQAVDGGTTESANVVETAIGAATLISDRIFDIS